MKRFYIITAIVLLTGALFAQTWQPSLYKYIQSYPQFELVQHPFSGAKAKNIFTSTEAITIIRNADTTNAQYQNSLKYLTGNSFYSFFTNKKLYMLSYDTCSTCFREPSLRNPITRGLYLFRLDVDKWTKVSDAVQTDYFSLDSSINKPNIPQHNVWSSYCYFPWRTAGDLPNDKGRFGEGVKDGSVTISSNGEVTIVLVNRKYYYNDKYTDRSSFENRTIVLVPNNEGTYKVQ
jgi:hypothetical protein